ncbi:NnrS family protein [Sphingosinicella sp.]|uniref:NnrS family protein n=1 Tax=Sphingosinicella xenopeptidilytica TaxID=364098 RepID=A0ABW3C5D7_SPHXN
MNHAAKGSPFRLLGAAPHRLPFLTGVFNLLMLPLWWLARLTDAHWFPLGLPQGDALHATLHGPVTVYALFMPFILGFLATVFPRWMGLDDLPSRRFLPAAIPMMLGSLLLAAALWSDQLALLNAALALMLAGWGIGAVLLASVLLAHCKATRKPHWHGLSALAGWLLALAGLALLLAFTAGEWAPGRAASILLGTHGLTAAIFVTVCHRMIPFFAGNVVAGYVSWRPYWLLGLFWPLLLADIVATHCGSPLRGLIAAAMTLLLLMMLWRWTPRRPVPGLLMVLLWGFAWAPASFLFAALATVAPVPPIAAIHALLLGMGASLLVAMVTRVTQGHSGRPLTMPAVAWLAFGAVQAAALARLGAALTFEHSSLLLIAALLLTLGVFPWVLRGGTIYLSPRKDGRPG